MGHMSSYLSGSKLWLELSDLDKSRHEGGHGCYQQNDIVRFWITHMQRATLDVLQQFMVARSKWLR